MNIRNTFTLLFEKETKIKPDQIITNEGPCPQMPLFVELIVSNGGVGKGS